jgi:Zn-dependent oligopeptidase
MNPQNKITYSEEKIQSFIPLVEKAIKDSTAFYNALVAKTFDVPFRDYIENGQTYKSVLDRIKKMMQIVNQEHSKYFSVIEHYDINASPNVDKLEQLVDQLDKVYMKFSKLEDTVEELILLAEKNKS